MAIDTYKPSKILICIAEFVGTALLLFFGCMGCITEYEGAHIPHYMPCLTFGLSVFLIIQIFGHISGAHLNPAVTIAALVQGLIDLQLVPIYVVAQFAGAILGFGVLKLVMPFKYMATKLYDPVANATITRIGVCTTMPHEDLNVFQAVAIEAIITGVLILVCCAVWDKRNADKVDSVSLRFGFAVAVLALAAGPFTGASLNTARSFAPALLNGNWQHQWIYWIAPNLGAVGAVFFYKVLFNLPPEAASSEETGTQLQPLNNDEEKV